MEAADQPEPGSFLGSGLSASVFLRDTDDGEVARKAFGGARIAALVNILLRGAPNDYAWCEAAIRAAHFRRRVLARLVPFWLGDSFQVADSLGWGASSYTGFQYLDTRFATGTCAPMQQPFRHGKQPEFHELTTRWLPQLHRLLVESGFVGTVWQAGLGQPCAYANFLVRRDADQANTAWTWIDLESGVPAVAATSIAAWWNFYLPQTWRRRRPLFDDLHEPTLRSYLRREAASLQEHLGQPDYRTLLRDVAELVRAHHEWDRETRLSRSLGYAFAKGMITVDERHFYGDRPAQWYAYLLRRVLRALPGKTIRWAVQTGQALWQLVRPGAWVPWTYNMLSSRTYRTRVVRQFIVHAADEWHRLGRLSSHESDRLRRELFASETSWELGDFGFHLAIKPLAYVIKLCVLPILWQVGLLTPAQFAFLFLFVAPIFRFLYALFCCLTNPARGLRSPWIALAISPIPSFGNLAFPCQMIRSARDSNAGLAFAVYDSFSRVACRIPIWGGRWSGAEYLLNRWAGYVISGLRRRAAKHPLS